MSSYFKAAKPLSIRIWHWISFLFFFFSVITVVLGSTVLRTRNNIELVVDQVKEKGGSVTADQARSVAHEFSDKMWMLHKYIGFGLSILLFWRLFIEISLSKQSRLLSKIKAVSLPAKNDGEASHYYNVHRGYLLFYLMFILMSLTGLVLAFEDVKWLDPIHSLAKTIHSYLQYALYAFMIIHIIGVIRADVYTYNGIVSRMINGKQ